MNPKSLIFLFGVLICTSLIAQYRPDSNQYRVETRDRNVFIGYIISHERDELVLQTNNLGVVRIQTSQIRRIEIIKSKSPLTTANSTHGLHSTAYFNLPSGYGLRQGEAYYKNTGILINHASIGISDKFSIGAGCVPLFLASAPNTPVWVTPKISMPLVPNRFNISITPIIGGVSGYNGVFTFIHTAATIGRRDKNITGGLIFGYFNGQLYAIPILTLSGVYQVRERWFLVSENYMAKEGGLLIVGGRSMFKHLSIDYGLAATYDTNSNYGAGPWASLMIPLNLWNF